MIQIRMRTAVVWLVLGAVTVPLATITPVILGGIRRSIEQQVDRSTAATAELVGTHVRQFQDGARYHLEAILDVLEQGSLVAPAKVDAFLASHAARAPFFESICVLDGQGVVRHVHPVSRDLLGTDFSRRDFFAASRGGAPGAVWGNAYLSPLSGNTTFPLAVRGKSAVVVGFVDLRQLAASLRLGPGVRVGDVLVTDGAGTALVHPNPLYVAQRRNLRSLEPVGRALDGRAAGLGFRDEGREMLGRAVLVRPSRWVILVQQPKDQAFVLYRTIRGTVLAVAPALALVFLAVAFLLAKKMGTALDTVLARIHLLREGAPVPLPARPGAFTELRSIFDGFADMADAVSQRERELARAKSEWESTFEAVPDAVLLLDRESRVVRANRAARSWYAAQGETLEGAFCWEVVRGEAGPPAGCLNRATLDTGEAQRAEFWNARLGATLEVHTTPVFDERGGVAGTVHVARDITDRRRAEDRLRQGEERYRSILDSAMDGFWVADREGRLLQVNATYCRMSGYAEQELLSMRVADLEAREAPGDVAARLGGIVAQGEGRFETRHRRKDGSGFEVEASVQYQAADGGRLVAFLRDITLRKRAEEALRESEARHRDLLLNLPVGAYRSTPTLEGRFVVANPFMARMFGYPSVDELLGTNVQDLYQDQGDRKAFFAKLLAAGSVRREVLRLKKRDGTPIWGSVTVQVVRDAAGDVAHVDGFIEDVTELNRGLEEKAKLEAQLQQAQKMESVGRLAGGVAHDFNNMLGVILGYAEMALELVEPGQPLHRDLLEICAAANRSAVLTRQLLAFARRQTIAPKVLDLGRTVADMLKMLQRLIGENIELVWLPGADLWPVRVDPSQVDQILANLCVNARDAIGGVGKVILETRNATLDAEFCSRHAGFVAGQYVQLSVSDDGCGMDRETLGHIFEPFFTTKGVGEGTGLGLATVYGAVKQNDGFISAYSEPGRGTTFTLYFPRHGGNNARPGADQEAAGPPPGGRETILLVEDEEAILDVALRMLTSRGYRVLATDSPDEALRLAGEHPGQIHLLLTDVVMPQMNGRDLARQLLATQPGLKALFMSGYPADVIAHHGVLEEGVDFLQKPFTVTTLAAKLREVLDGRRAAGGDVRTPRGARLE